MPRKFEHYGAFESTKIHGCGADILDTTRHTQLWQADLDMLHTAGITRLRYSVPWHKIERERGVYDFTWLDGPMRCLERHGMTPVLDPLHHTSFPDWLEGGFANPEFPEIYQAFIERLATRYGWVNHYTVFNEPLPTTLFCSLTGMWYPHQRGERNFIGMAMNVGRAICLASATLRRLNPQIQLVHIDTCEQHRALDGASAPWVDFVNERRFLMHDLVLGRIGRGHRLMPYLRENGFSDRYE